MDGWMDGGEVDLPGRSTTIAVPKARRAERARVGLRNIMIVIVLFVDVVWESWGVLLFLSELEVGVQVTTG